MKLVLKSVELDFCLIMTIPRMKNLKSTVVNQVWHCYYMHRSYNGYSVSQKV